REIKCGLVAASLLRPLQRAWSEFCDDGNEHLIPLQPELRRFDRHGQLDFRGVRAERVLQLPLPVFGREHAEVLRCVVTLSRADMRSGGELGDLYVDAPPAAIPRCVPAV